MEPVPITDILSRQSRLQELLIESNIELALIRQTAVFDPVGLAGLLYWYLLVPAHAVVFQGMLNGIARRARARRG